MFRHQETRTVALINLALRAGQPIAAAAFAVVVLANSALLFVSGDDAAAVLRSVGRS